MGKRNSNYISITSWKTIPNIHNNIEWPKVVAKYNELYGNGSYEEDISDLDSSLEMYGRTTVHMERIDELSSPF